MVYLEQYIITAYSSATHDPARVPTCQPPDAKSCDSLTCSWKDAIGTPIMHTYQFKRCSKPQAVDLVLMAGLHHYEWTFDKSTMVTVNYTMRLNVTVKHPSDQTIGFQVSKPATGLSVVLHRPAILYKKCPDNFGKTRTNLSDISSTENALL